MAIPVHEPNQTAADHEVRLSLLEQSDLSHREDIKRMQTWLEKISETMVRLAETQSTVKHLHERIAEVESVLRDHLEKVEKRFSAVDKVLPSLLEFRTWGLLGLGLVLTTVLLSLLALVVTH